MKRITGLMKNICTMKNALNAYQKARRCKRYRPEVLEFEANREEYLGKAIRELESLTYTPGKYKVFKVWEPKERIIMALPFYDRVIQHMIVNYIEPIFEHQFIYHSYACRKGKGAHRASKQLTRWLYNLEVVQGKSVYVLKADIHHYFQSIDHKVLKREIRTYIKDKDLLVILDRIIDHNGIFPDGVGIPVGNLTSQLFANVYLHRLDMFVKHTLHAEHYSSNVMAAVTAVVISVALSAGYLIYTETMLNAKIGVELIALAYLSFLVATNGYDKVIQAIKQIKQIGNQ